MRLSIVLHQEKPMAHYTSIKSNNCSEDFIQVSHSSQGTIGYDIEVCATHQEYAARDHHWPTTKPVLLYDATNNITFTMASPDSFKPVTRAQCEPALICCAIVGLPILVFSHESRSSCILPLTVWLEKCTPVLCLYKLCFVLKHSQSEWTHELAHQTIFGSLYCLLTPSWSKGSSHQLKLIKCGQMKLKQPCRTSVLFAGENNKTKKMAEGAAC